jgi:hypothetical protein
MARYFYKYLYIILPATNFTSLTIEGSSGSCRGLTDKVNRIEGNNIVGIINREGGIIELDINILRRTSADILPFKLAKLFKVINNN